MRGHGGLSVLREHPALVAAHEQTLVVEGADLAFQLPCRPASLDGLRLIKFSRRRFLHAQQYPVVRPRETGVQRAGPPIRRGGFVMRCVVNRPPGFIFGRKDTQRAAFSRTSLRERAEIPRCCIGNSTRIGYWQNISARNPTHRVGNWEQLRILDWTLAKISR